MKKFLLLPLLGLFFYLPAQIVYIPDANFKNALVNTLCVDADTDGFLDADVDINNDGEIQVSEALEVTVLDVTYDTIVSLTGIESFSNLQSLKCDGNQLTVLDLQGLIYLQWVSCSSNNLTYLNVEGLNNLLELHCNGNQFTNLNLEGLTSLQSLFCSVNFISSLDLGGLSNLKTVICGNSELNSINLQGLTNLEYLDCTNGQITTIDVHELISLKHLNLTNNLLISLDLQGLNNLQVLICSFNQLTTLDFQGLDNLQTIYCSYNQITSLNFQEISNVENLSLEDNQVSILDVHHLINLKLLHCPGNQIVTLNLENSSKLNWFSCNDNQMTSLYIKNGSIEENELDFSGNPNLSFICCDEVQLNTIQDKAFQNGLFNCSINTYCTFIPGGEYYIIQGENKLDSDSNGCEPNDILYPGMKFHISDGTTSGTIISNQTGHYKIPVEDGIYNLTPDIENPAYFSISPEMIQVSFPDAGDTLIQDFCLIPNGVHHDLEVSIVPILPARPGFEATYELIFKNKGNQVENGVLTFYFYDILMDLIEASLIPDNQESNNLEWNFSDLLPFETRVIHLTFYCNSPAEMPPLNVDDILVFDATIQGAQVDETPDDNHCYLLQTVVGSFDPNDKTCLEGAIISENMVGDFAHYLIRFENTGTYPAENIVVKDIINTNTFDVSSLQIVASSHEVWTRIVQDNQVEFIFENIQLPFTDAENDGYIAFKIKTKTDLVIGDTLKNMAAIYFDYNLPIITNEAQSTIQNVIVSTENLGYGHNEMAVFPNPTRDILHFQTSGNISKVEIFDTNGRILQAIGITDNQVSFQGLPGGTYLLKVYVSNEIYYSKVVKM